MLAGNGTIGVSGLRVERSSVARQGWRDIPGYLSIPSASSRLPMPPIRPAPGTWACPTIDAGPVHPWVEGYERTSIAAGDAIEYRACHDP